MEEPSSHVMEDRSNLVVIFVLLVSLTHGLQVFLSLPREDDWWGGGGGEGGVI